MDIRWVTAFIDRPANRFEEAMAFWARVSGSTLSSWRGEDCEFASLLPVGGGDAHLRVQRTQSELAGSHIDLHVDDVRGGAEECLQLGASLVGERGRYAVLTSPGGMVFCVVPHRSERIRQRPVDGPSGTTTLVDQVCIDADPDTFDDEVQFWSRITGWAPLVARTSEFVPLHRPSSMPLRVILQRRASSTGTASCHLDIACQARQAAIGDHELAGAVAVRSARYWTVMTDAAGAEYCLTSRRPDTGQLPPAG